MLWPPRNASAKTQLNLDFPPPTKIPIAIYNTMCPSGGGRIINKPHRRRCDDGLLLLLLGRRRIPRRGGWWVPSAPVQPLQRLLRRKVPCARPTQTSARRRVDPNGWGNESTTFRRRGATGCGVFGVGGGQERGFASVPQLGYRPHAPFPAGDGSR